VGKLATSAPTPGLASIFQLWHLCDFVLLAIICLNCRYHGPDLVFGFALRLLQEIPERINQNIVGRYALVFLASAYLFDPPDRCSLFGCETNRSPLGVVRDVFLSGAHGSDFY